MRPPKTNLKLIGPDRSHETGRVDDGDDPEEYAATDLANARRFVDQYRGSVHFLPNIGWAVYNKQRWILRAKNLATELAKMTARRIRNELCGHIPSEQSEQIERLKWAKTSQSRPKILAMLDLAKTDPALWLATDKLDTHQWLLNLRNGTLDLKTGELRKHQSKDYISKMTDVEYDPTARAPRFEQFIAEVFPQDQEMREFVQRCVGYSLTGDVSEQVFFLCHGSGSNGKSVFLAALQSVIGEYGINLRAESLMAKQVGQSPNELVRLPGARVATVSEIGQHNSLNEALVKDITGGDRVTARFLYKEGFDFRPNAKIWMQGNYLPTIHGRDHGIWRRALVIPFVRQFRPDDRDPHLLQELRRERSGILNWAIEGCRSWQKMRLKPPATVFDAVSEYKSALNSVESFIRECTVESEEPRTSSTELFHAYEEWCEANGVEKLRTLKAFGTEMKQSYGERRKQLSRGICYYLALKEEKSN